MGVRDWPLSVLLFSAFFILIVSCFLGLQLGYISIDTNQVLNVLWYRLVDSYCIQSDAFIADSVWDFRLPRVLLSACSGMGLSLSGTVMQSVFRNPLVGPYIMGISSGAALGAACVIFLGLGISFGASSVGMGACLGAVFVSLLTVLFYSRNKNQKTANLLLFGIAMNAVCSGITSVLVYAGANSSGMDITLYWMMGTVAGAKLYPTLFLLTVVLLAAFYFYSQSRILNLMLAGEETAVTLGYKLSPYFIRFLLINAILTGCIVMNTGLLGFIGLLVPHFMRFIAGTDHRRLLPLAILGGGIIGVWADIFSRTIITGRELPLGVVISLIGSPIFILLLIMRAKGFYRRVL